MKVNVVTLGCPKNLVDSETLLGQLKHHHVQIVSDLSKADTIVINTCGFIQDAKQESIDAILEAVEKKKHGTLKKIVVMGCLSERFHKELAAEIPEVDVYLGTNRLRDVLKHLGKESRDSLLGERYLLTPSHYAYLKISEGCDNPCSFCAIPLMRGKHASRPLKTLIHEAELLSEKGVKELIVIAQDTTYYGVDLYGKRRLAHVLDKLQSINGIEWIRLMYAYPAKFPFDIIEAYQNNSKLCRYIDIPIQHISDTILKSMHRGITKKGTRELLIRLKREIPGLALRTTIISGYPGERESDFLELCDFIEEMQFHRLGVFPYSQEEGTKAFALGDPVPLELKQERVQKIMEIQKNISEQRNESMIGTSCKVIVDSKENGLYVGRTEWDAPEIDQEVFIHSNKTLPIGSFRTVTVTDASEYDLSASA
jgi:ribosomal protein S12 methylthiotransferase